MKRPITMIVVVLLGLGAAYLAAWPVPIEPKAWHPPRAPALQGPYAANERLRGTEWIGKGVALGPEATAIDGQGRVYTGTRDGRILRLDPASGRLDEIARTGGRPLGMAFGPDGTLWICDGARGLLARTSTGELRVIATGEGGRPFRFPDDVDVAPDGTVYFTDASSKFGPRQYREDVLEHGGNGRLLAYDPRTGKTKRLLEGLDFANGVAVAGDGSFLVVSETGSYRLLRYWLAGARRGSSEVFIDNLPGLPDNVTYSKARRTFWVALFSPRVPALDTLAAHPFLRKVVYRVPRFLQPQPKRTAFVLALDENGHVVESLMDDSPGSFAPVTSVREHHGVLWLGSLERDALGRIAAPIRK